MAYTIDAEYESWGAYINTANNNLESIETAITEAASALTDAVAACGGEGSNIGSALTEHLVSVDDSTFKSLKTRITNILEGLGKTKTSYENAEQDILSDIAKAAGAGSN